MDNNLQGTIWPDSYNVADGIYQHGCPREDNASATIRDDPHHMASSSNSSPFPGSYDDMSLFKSGLYDQKKTSDYGNVRHGHYYGRIQSRAGKSVDPRLLTLLEFFKQLYVRRKEMFRKIFPGLHDELVEISEKVGSVLTLGKSDENKVRSTTSLKRSLSVGSKARAIAEDDAAEFRLQRFKIRTVVPGGGGGGGPGGAQDDKGNTPDNTKSSDSNSK